MDLIIRNRKINAPIEDILRNLRSQTNGRYLKDIQNKGRNVLCTCPFHKAGAENKPACMVLNDLFDPDLEYGVFHCYACKESGRLPKFIGKVLEETDLEEAGENWLVSNYGDSYVETELYLPKIEFSRKQLYLNPDILNNFSYDNKEALDYLIKKRHLSKEVIEYFKIGFDKSDNCITFPCWNESGKLVGIFKRSIYTKFFHIPEISPKPIYLLNEIIKGGYTDVYVVESQINALTLWSWCIPAIALFGTGSSDQLHRLCRSGIRNYTLAFDGDSAGRSGREKFIKNRPLDAFVSYIDLPEGSDVNDLTFSEFANLKRIDI